MSWLRRGSSAAARIGTQVRANSRPVELVLEVYTNIDIPEKEINGGFLICLIPVSQQKARDGVNGDLRFMSGMISKKLENHPAWEESLNARLGNEGIYHEYIAPSNDNNYTKRSCVVDGEIKSAPGAWTWQALAKNVKELGMVLHAFVENILCVDAPESNWRAIPGTKLLTQRCAPAGRPAWFMQWSLHIALYGSAEKACLESLRDFLLKNEWCFFDGSLAFDKDALQHQLVLCRKNSDEECQTAMEAKDEALVRAVAESSNSFGSPFRGVKRKQEFGNWSPSTASLSSGKASPATPSSNIALTAVSQCVATGDVDSPVVAKSAVLRGVVDAPVTTVLAKSGGPTPVTPPLPKSAAPKSAADAPVAPVPAKSAAPRKNPQ